MNLSITTENFKKIIIVFWTLWWLIAFWTDVVGGFTHIGWLHAAWAPDMNLPFLTESLKMYSAPVWLVNSLFIAILAWSLVSTLAFCWASVALCRENNIWMQRAKIAFIISLTYWLAFFLADQVVMKFDLEQNHMVQGGFQLLTFLTLYWLPERNV